MTKFGLILIAILLVFAPRLNAGTKLKIDFSKDQESTNWYVVVDRVMGGRSSGDLSFTNDGVSFVGEVSLANNGGFASIRSDYSEFDLSPYKLVEIKYRASGQSFAFTLNHHKRYYMPRFKHPLPETGDEWAIAVLRFSDFKKVRLGETLDGQLGDTDLREVIRLGLISNDKRASAFELEVEYIGFR